ncbi:bifunctional 2-polyprenyl-6-hydroxyphenol methylase/3-demethylubiquinol 3-O-methyltransferase UbiG [Chitinophaga sp. sic0106]|uniref:class I SAM-dependent methyltransferase n=1 Tax=Chitinophaga sp. sic0106 TaxID=2854785 RepID=UPI001C43FA10|nr:class I SAM-dependent methyltransferase [Chitinophaga sp. sic0106]MBV7533814.1 class I SAM-dependent methyltransferase [Chitinophaga sp. sic0106]
MTNHGTPEFWEAAFSQKQEMWGFTPAHSAMVTKDYFIQNNVKSVLIPGIGYGRNAQPFLENGMQVTGIEISQTAIDIAHKHFGGNLPIYHGSVTDMPFDTKMFDGIFCYALIHLLNETERKKLISDCYNQLSDNGHMVFTMITKEAQTYGKGQYISKDRYEMFGGINMYFYDKEAVTAEFSGYGLTEIRDITESYPFYLVICKR